MEQNSESRLQSPKKPYNETMDDCPPLARMERQRRKQPMGIPIEA
jgi:hypothetical protein